MSKRVVSVSLDLDDIQAIKAIQEYYFEQFGISISQSRALGIALSYYCTEFKNQLGDPYHLDTLGLDILC